MDVGIRTQDKFSRTALMMWYDGKMVQAGYLGPHGETARYLKSKGLPQGLTMSREATPG